MLDYPLDASGLRQHQVRQLVRFIAETASRRDLIVVCGDFMLVRTQMRSGC